MGADDVFSGVNDGYRTNRFLPETRTQDDINHHYFRSAIDTLHDVYSNRAIREVPRMCDAGTAPSFAFPQWEDRTSKKRRTSEKEGDDSGLDEEGGDTVMNLPSLQQGTRTIRAPPQRRSGFRVTQSMPVGGLNFSGGPTATSLAAAPFPGSSAVAQQPSAAETWATDVDFGDVFDQPDDF